MSREFEKFISIALGFNMANFARQTNNPFSWFDEIYEKGYIRKRLKFLKWRKKQINKQKYLDRMDKKRMNTWFKFVSKGAKHK